MNCYISMAFVSNRKFLLFAENYYFLSKGSQYCSDISSRTIAVQDVNECRLAIAQFNKRNILSKGAKITFYGEENNEKTPKGCYGGPVFHWNNHDTGDPSSFATKWEIPYSNSMKKEKFQICKSAC